MLDIADSVRPIDRSATFQVFDLLILVNFLVIRICTLIVVKAEPTCGALAFAVCRPAGDDVICDIAAVAIILIVGVVARGGSERSEILVIESIIRTGSLIIQDGTVCNSIAAAAVIHPVPVYIASPGIVYCTLCASVVIGVISALCKALVNRVPGIKTSGERGIIC